MRNKIVKTGLVVLGGAFMLTGCVVRERDTYHPASGEVSTDVEVGGPPPPEIVETETYSPGPGFVWIGGYYAWAGGRWNWTPGIWVKRPYPGAVWVRPHYVNRGGRHLWVRGRWR